jgi:hypothetical protein
MATSHNWTKIQLDSKKDLEFVLHGIQQQMDASLQSLCSHTDGDSSIANAKRTTDWTAMEQKYRKRMRTPDAPSFQDAVRARCLEVRAWLDAGRPD